jgi:hypothetical protein
VLPTRLETETDRNGHPEVAVEAKPTAVAAGAAEPSTPVTEPSTVLPPQRPPVAWPTFLRTASTQEIKERLAAEIGQILQDTGLSERCCLALIEPQESIDSFDLDQVFTSLQEVNPQHDKDVVLFILSTGGAGEPAYQISKICKSFSREKFIVVVPRYAKSAATLIAIGADEIHMGPLGQLGPIDPQIGGLPALGVSQALKTIASVAESYPKSAEMFARYLRLALTVEQIGYCDRIAESAMQYAERLLTTKSQLANKASKIAKELVHTYKDHNFVIDLAEAQEHLGADWIKTGTPELQAGEKIYTLIEMVNFMLGFGQKKRLLVTGGITRTESILILDKTR